MTEKAQRESAKIYPFPRGGRAGLEAERAAWRAAAEPVPSAEVIFGGSWYHDEAVREAQPIGQR